MKYKKMIIAGTLLSVIGLASAQTEEAYYVSGKLIYAEHKAKNMDTSARPGIGAFVSGDNSKKYTSGSVALGYQFASDWRVEGEYTIPKKNKYTSGSTAFSTSFNHHKIKAQRLMVNVYKDFYLTPEFGLYATAGLGVSELKSSGWQGNESRQYHKNTDRNITYSVGVGATYRPIEKLNIDFGYRFVDMGKTESGWNAFGNARGLQDEQMKAKVESNELYLGIRYTIP